MSVSLFQSFNESLPDIPQDSARLRPATASGDTTRTTNPPVISFATSLQDWFLSADYVLQRQRNNNIIAERLAQPEDMMFHRTEADVVRSSSLYLLHPVNQALSSFTYAPDAITCRSECTLATMRSDVVYFKTPATIGSQAQARSFSVLEYKRRGMIKLTEFQSSCRPTNGVPSRAIVEGFVNEIRLVGRHTAFGDGARILMQQASAYAIAHGTQYVALFDWDSLVLIRFDDLDVQLSTQLRAANGIGDYCYITCIPSTQTSAMRKALLGFLYSAWGNAPC